MSDALDRLHARIRACTRCALAGHIPAARPVVAGTLADRIALVGQAPGAVELTTGTPFSGRSGQVLRQWLARAGFAEGELPYRTSVTKCFPGKAPGGAGDRRPSPAEIALCAPWLERELALLRPAVVVLLGGMAIDRFWGRVPLDQAIGRSRHDADRVLIPFPHPSGASRWLNAPSHRALLERAIGHLARERRRLSGRPAARRSA